jgi:hypothetical protein
MKKKKFFFNIKMKVLVEIDNKLFEDIIRVYNLEQRRKYLNRVKYRQKHDKSTDDVTTPNSYNAENFYVNKTKIIKEYLDEKEIEQQLLKMKLTNNLLTPTAVSGGSLDKLK